MMPPCTSVYYDMKQTLINDIANDDYPTLWLSFNFRMPVSEQIWSYTFMSYIAENGGFVGLFLGLAVLHLEDVILGVLNRINDNI